MRLIVFAAAILAAACTPVSAVTTPAAPSLRPYATITPSPTSGLPAGLIVSAETPLPSPTPSQYTIQSGDTLSQIAERFRITLDALLLANPDMDPNALRVGETLRIPGSPADRAGEATPTPVPFPVRQIACHPTASGAIWCFVLIHNDTPDIIENVTAQVTLVDSAGAALDSKTALLPLDVLLPGASMPLSVLFPPPIPLDAQPRVQFLTAIRLFPGDQRYLPAAVRNNVTEVSWSGRSAELRGEVFLPDGSAGASVVWLAAVAYDGSGNVVGWRRWENSSGLAAGSSLPFALTVSSVAGRIDRVEYAVQARP
ncbi:MAG: LysM peptidoglycan-binding domain-containing protein [Chloroflexota bacterium]